MRRVLLSLTLGSLFLVAVPRARAGVYDLAQKRAFAGRSSDDRDVRKQLEEMSIGTYLGDMQALRSMNDGAPTALEKKPTLDRKLLLEKVAKLEAKEKEAPLPVEEVVTLSAYLIRLGRTDQARTLLEKTRDKLADNDPYKFLVLLHLAAAYEATPELLQRAVLTQREALAAWPKEFKGWSADDVAWYRIAEGYYQKYLEARFIEVQRNNGVPPLESTPAPVFPKARFDEPGREYQAGSFGPETADALPLDAQTVVAQLLFWRPNDNRLYWLYGEILNGRGNLQEAKGIFNDLYENRSVKAAKAHRDVLKEVPPPAPPVEPVPPPPAPELLVLDWRQIAGSFLAGAVVTALVLLQWRQWSRRNG